jgi:nucleotide-binding universal stress UspA family protein
LNSFGVPNLGLLAASIVPLVLVLIVTDMGGLADLYAVGVVGAIATNLGASSTDRKLGLVAWERALMFCTFLIMAGIEISLFWDKPSARVFAGSVLLVGLILRGLAAEHAQRVKAAEAVAGNGNWKRGDTVFLSPPVHYNDVSGPAMMCAIRGLGKTLDFAVEEAKRTNSPLYLLFIRSTPVLTEDDYKKKWQDDPEAREIFIEARKKAGTHPVFPCYAVSDAVAQTIVDITATTGASYLILGAPGRGGLSYLLRANLLREITNTLPEDIHLLVYA